MLHTQYPTHIHHAAGEIPFQEIPKSLLVGRILLYLSCTFENLYDGRLGWLG